MITFSVGKPKKEFTPASRPVAAEVVLRFQKLWIEKVSSALRQQMLPEIYNDYLDPFVTQMRWGRGTVEWAKLPTFTIFEEVRKFPHLSPEYLGCTFQIRFWHNRRHNYVIYTFAQFEEAAEDLLEFLQTKDFNRVKTRRSQTTITTERKEEHSSVTWLVPLRHYLEEGKQHEAISLIAGRDGRVKAKVQGLVRQRLYRMRRGVGAVINSAQQSPRSLSGVQL